MNASDSESTRIGPWTWQNSRDIYQNPWIHVREDKVIRPDGEEGIYGVVEFANWAIGVVALDASGRIVLVGQHRYPLNYYSWEIPEGARVTYMEGGETGEGSASKRAKKDGTNSMWVLVGLLVPIMLPLLGLAACYWQATREGLAEALKELGKRRERARKRRGSKAGSNFKQRQKLSQDGKGGRSANS